MQDKTELVLKKIDEFVKKQFLPIIGRTKGKLLEQLIKKYNPKLVLEIGTLIGYSTILIARNLKQGKIITIEINPNYIKIAKQHIKESNLKNKVKIIIGDAVEIIPKLKKKFDFIFIDATKEQYLTYLKLLENKIEKGTIIVADNAKIFATEMEDYLNYVRTNKNYKSKFYDFGDDGVEVTIKL